MSGTRTNPDHSHPCSITLASVSFICFSYLFPLSVSLCNITHSQVKAIFLINKSKTNLHFLFTRSLDRTIYSGTPLSGFSCSSWSPCTSCSTSSGLTSAPLSSDSSSSQGAVKKRHSSRKVLRPALRQSLDRNMDRMESAIWAICPVIASTAAVSLSIRSRKGPVLKQDLDPDGPATSTISSSLMMTFAVFFFFRFSPPHGDVAVPCSFTLPFALSTTRPSSPTSGHSHFSFSPAHFMHALCLGLCQVRVYSGRGSGQVRTKADKGEGQRAGQGISPAGVETNWIQRQGGQALIPCVGSSQGDGVGDRQRLE